MTIEFRWLDKGWALNRGGRHTVSRDLQFRVQVKEPDSEGHPALMWTKWKTVPTVRANVEPK